MCCFFKRAKDKGISCTCDPTKGVEVCVDTDFVGSWTLADSLDIELSLSRAGYVIKVGNCIHIMSQQDAKRNGLIEN